MYNITLVGTHHVELGKCNSDELYKVIESVGPDVIFEELSPDVFDMIYNKTQIPGEPPEIKSIKKYLLNHDISHIPVDITPNPHLPMSDIKYMFGIFKKYNVYKKLEDEQIEMTTREGFAFLNSKKCLELSEEKKIMEKYLMESMINKNQLIHIHNLLFEDQYNRDAAMLNNIYNYSKENSYDRAIFTVGAEHRKSIMQKIQEYEAKEQFKLNWTFYTPMMASE